MGHLLGEHHLLFRMILFLIMLWIAGRLIYRWKFEKKSVN
jgi:hypothetical protein